MGRSTPSRVRAVLADFSDPFGDELDVRTIGWDSSRRKRGRVAPQLIIGSERGAELEIFNPPTM